MKPTVVFDLDGTLVDSLADIKASFRWVLRQAGYPEPDDAAMSRLIGRPLAEMFREAAPGADEAALVAAFRDYYPRHLADHSRPYPGVPELLAALGRAGYARVVATTKKTPVAHKLIEAVGLANLIDHVQGTDGLPPKPAPDVVLAALAAVDGKGLWMVGDTMHDVGAGRAAGLATYAVTWGNHDAATLARANPDRLEPDLNALANLLLESAVV